MRKGVFLGVALMSLVYAPNSLANGELCQTEWVGFQNFAEASRILIKTNEPVQYRVTEQGPDVVLIDLFNTRLGHRNHGRPLDTSSFDTKVASLKAEELEGAARQVRIEVKLKEKTTYQAKQDDRALFIDFQR